MSDRWAEPKSVDTRAPLAFERIEIRLVHVFRQPGGIVVGPGEPRVPVDDDERIDPFRIHGSSHEHHLRPEPVRDEARALEPCGIHDRDEIVHPALDRTSFSQRPRHSDAACPEPEHAGETSERPEPFRDERLLDERFEVARPVENDDHVMRALAEYLIGDVRVARADVLGLGERHRRPLEVAA